MDKSNCKSLFFIVSLLLVNSFSASFAQEIPVNIKAERLKFIEETSIVEASGSVEVKFKEVTIHADSLLMDSETNIATAEGHVKIWAKRYSADAESLVYNASQEVVLLKNFRSRVSPEKVKGYLHLSVKELWDLGDMMEGHEAAETSCDNQVPHYFLVADKMEYYPNDKIVGYNVTLYVGGIPVLWFPYLFYDFTSGGKRNWVFGHNAVEGDYIKSTWGTPYGILYLDQMQNKGLGYGIDTTLGLLGLGAGSLYLYHLDEQDTNLTDWISRYRLTQKIDPATTVNLSHSYIATYLIPSGRRDQTAFNVDFAHKSNNRWNLRLNSFDDRTPSTQKFGLNYTQSEKKVSTAYYFNYDFSKKDPKWLRSSQRLSYKRPLWSDKVMLNTRWNYYNSVATGAAPGDERMDAFLELTGKEPWFSWRLTENRVFDFDGDTYTGDEGLQFLEKYPEIEINPKPIDLKLFTISPKFGYGHYREIKYVSALGQNRDYSTQKYTATLNASRSISLGMGTVGIVGAGLDQFLYAPGDQLFAFRQNYALNTKLFGFFKNNIAAKRGETEGNTPFLWDRLGTRYHNFTEKMTFYYKSLFNWSTNSGYNWQTHKWMNVMTKMWLKPTKKMYWGLSTGWDIENTRYKDLVNTLKVNPYDTLSMSFSTTSDMNEGVLRSGSILYDLYLLKGQVNQWRVKFSQVFDSASQQFKMRDIMVVKDLHCWELKYTYSEYRKEFSLTFSLKALPDQPIGYSSGKGLHFDGFERELNKALSEVKQEGGAVRRY